MTYTQVNMQPRTVPSPVLPPRRFKPRRPKSQRKFLSLVSTLAELRQ